MPVISRNPAPRYGTPDHSIINVDVDFSGQTLAYACSATDSVALSRDLFARAIEGEFGPVAAYKPPVTLFSAELIVQEYRRRFDAALQGKEPSLLSYGLRLQYESSSRELTADEHADFGQLGAIDLWQTAMIEVREALIAAADTTTYMLDTTWPASPSGLSAFLSGF